MGLNFHWRIGSSIRALKRFSCSSWPTSSQILMSRVPFSMRNFSTIGQSSRKRLCCLGEQKPMTYSTPARLYQLRSKITISPPADREKGEMYMQRYVERFPADIALHVHLALLAVGRRRKCHDTEDARADPLGDGLDRAALARRVTTFEHDDDPLAGGLDPVLKMAEL